MNLKLVILILLSIATKSYAGSISGAVTGTRLGVGVDPLTESVKRMCMEPATVSSDKLINDFSNKRDSEIGSSFQVAETRVIRSFKDYYSFSKQSMSAQANYLIYSGSASDTQTDSFSLQSDEITIGVRVAGQYGKLYLTDPVLKPSKRELLQKDPMSFINECGTEYVNGYEQGQSLTILMTSFSETVSSYHEHMQKISGGIQAAKGSGSASASLEQIAKSLLKYGSIRVNISGFGISGFSDLASVMTISNSDDVDMLMRKINSTIEKMTTTKLAITSYMTEPYDGLNTNDTISQIKKQKFETLYETYKRLTTNQNRLSETIVAGVEQSLGDVCSVVGYASCKAYWDSIIELHAKYTVVTGNLVNSLERCRESIINKSDFSCFKNELEGADVLLKTPIEWPRQFKNKFAMGEITGEKLAMAQRNLINVQNSNTREFSASARSEVAKNFSLMCSSSYLGVASQLFRLTAESKNLSVNSQFVNDQQLISDMGQRYFEIYRSTPHNSDLPGFSYNEKQQANFDRILGLALQQMVKGMATPNLGIPKAVMEALKTNLQNHNSGKSIDFSWMTSTQLSNIITRTAILLNGCWDPYKVAENFEIAKKTDEKCRQLEAEADRVGGYPIHQAAQNSAFYLYQDLRCGDPGRLVARTNSCTPGMGYCGPNGPMPPPPPPMSPYGPR